MAGALVLLIALAGPARAISGNVTTTFAVTTGSLSISAPTGPVSLGTGGIGSSVTAQLGSVTVTDLRAALSAAWTAHVSTTAFTPSGGGASGTVPQANVSYWSGPATATTGSGTFTPGQANAAAKQDLSATRTAFTLTSGTGNNTASFNPTLVVSIPITLTVGQYTATVTHTVA